MLQSSIIHDGGGTSFTAPLNGAMKILNSLSQSYEQHCILLYTDGMARYPSEAVDQLINLKQKMLQRKTFSGGTNIIFPIYLLSAYFPGVSGVIPKS